jgi:hypothetical protein
MIRAHITIATLVLLSLAGTSSGAVVFDNQTRTVSATSFAGTNADQAPDSLPWTGSASSFHRFSGTSASADQTSSLSDAELVVDSSIAAKDGQGPNGASSASVFDVTFILDEARTYTLNGSWSLDWDTIRTPGATVSLTRVGDATPIFSSTAVLGATPLLSDTFSIQGMLAPGTYRMIASISQDSLDPDNVLPQMNGSLHAQLLMEVPAPAGVGFGMMVALAGGRRRTRRMA